MHSILSRAGGIVHSIVGSIKATGKQDVTNGDSIQVCVRIRPILRNEREESYEWTWKNNTISPRNSIRTSYTFDHLFSPDNSNADIFDSVIKNTVIESMQGFHGTVFTYGQTSSGKTFTMNGTQLQPGIIPQSIFCCFDSIQNHFTDREFLIRVSYLEVYNEQVKDLLSTEPTQIRIQYDSKLGTILSGVKEQVVLNSQQVIALLKAGEAHRHVGNTDMNEKSSRAHTLLKLIIESKQRGDTADTPVRVSVLNLVDLAGSENAKMTNSTGERAREAKCINQSLLTLSLIIQRLSKEKSSASDKQYLPFRDSKLTRLLQSSLSGSARIAIICTVSPTLKCVEESYNTLKFAARAKRIKTNANINEMMDDKTLLRAYKIEIHSLKARLAAVESQNVTKILSEVNTLSEQRSGQSTTEENDEAWYSHVGDGEEESAEILQMISEMERLILKADLSSDNLALRSKSALAPTTAPLIQDGIKVAATRKSGLQTPSNVFSPKKVGKVKIKDNENCSNMGKPDSKDSLPARNFPTLPIEIRDTKATAEYPDRSSWEQIESPTVPYNLTGTTDDEETIDVSTDYLRVSELNFEGSAHSRHSEENQQCATTRPAVVNKDNIVSPSPPPAAHKFGFVPSSSLSKSFFKVAKDVEMESQTVKSSSDVVEKHLNRSVPSIRYTKSPTLSSSRTSIRTSPQQIVVNTTDQVEQHLLLETKSNSDINQALFGVPQMLAVLKQYVEKSSTIKRRPVKSQRLSLSKGEPLNMDQLSFHVSHSPSEEKSIAEDYRLLQIELEKKDNLLAMLTQGLREVEASQERWLAENDNLFRELEQALEENQELNEDIARLREELKVKESLVFEEIDFPLLT